ncbi:hypothetical protein EI94DRAFT_1724481 [Lactarius quietus]|nr:hypothetical protein EI94DRAFT_1724481 [Lactarius quietus]
MSFISVEPQLRVVLESHSNSLIGQIDTHLRILVDRYLAFFQERRRVEAVYINSLRKLHRKAKALDASFDTCIAEPTNMRTAWDIVRDSLEREASTQQTFVDMLDNGVISPLRALKESKDKARMRVEEDLMESAVKYADHAENTISKLQEAYLKKYHPREYAHSTRVPRRPEDVPNRGFGHKVSTLFRGRQEAFRGSEPAQSEEVSVTDDDCRSAVSRLNTFRLMRAENLGDGYDNLQELVFTPIIKAVLIKYVDGMSTVCTEYGKLAMSTEAEVENALAGTDTSDLRASFRRALSFSIPPQTLYHRNYRPGAYSELIFGVPLVDLETREDSVPKVMRKCIEEVEKRGLNAVKIYSVGHQLNEEVLELRRRFETEKTFSFCSIENIHFVAILLKRYLWDLPEPLLVLSLQDYRYYIQHRARETKYNFSLLRSKIRELNSIQRATLEFLLRHLLRVASFSGQNEMTVEALATEFRYPILRGNKVLQGGVNAKKLVMEDLIQHVHTLFDERPSPSQPGLSSNAAETIYTYTPSTYTYSALFSSSEPPGVPATATTTRHRPGPVGVIPTSTQSSFSSPSDATMESRPTLPPTGLLSPLLGLPSSQTLAEEVETTTQEPTIPNDTKEVETSAISDPEELRLVPVTSVAEWRLRQLQLSPRPEAVTIPQSPPESVLSSRSGFPLSSATSLRTGMGGNSP